MPPRRQGAVPGPASFPPLPSGAHASHAGYPALAATMAPLPQLFAPLDAVFRAAPELKSARLLAALIANHRVEKQMCLPQNAYALRERVRLALYEYRSR